MTRPTITTLDGKKHELKKITGRSWRILAEFIDNQPEFVDVDFIEKHADFIANFYDGVTADNVLDLPIEDILPASANARKYVMEQLTAKLEKIEKNSVADVAPSD